MPWRYQPVWVDMDAGDGPERVFSLCRCYFDEDGALASWTDDSAMVPQGGAMAELRNDLTRMWADAWKWEPVAFESLRPGMSFTGTGIDAEDIIGAMNKAIELGMS